MNNIKIKYEVFDILIVFILTIVTSVIMDNDLLRYFNITIGSLSIWISCSNIFKILKIKRGGI